MFGNLVKKTKERFIVNKNYVYILSFFIPIIILLNIYAGRGVYPFGNNMYLARDMYHQYAPFFSEFYNKLLGGGDLSYSWNIGMGTNFTGLYAYYLSSPINWFLVLIKREYLIEFMNLIIILKIALSSLTFTYYLSKHFKRKDLMMVGLSLFYALSSYVAAYSWNIMWLDCLVLLPLIILGLEKLVKENKGYLYCITLGLSIISNYYISFMICIYCILYFIVLLFTNNSGKGWTYYKQRLIRFAMFSILAGGFAAFLLIPEYYALKVSASGDISFPDTINRYFSIYEIISRGLMNVEVSATTNNDPNIYSSILVFLLLPLYWLLPSRNKKDKIGKTLLAGFFIVTFNFNISNFIWHGFHFPNSLPCRQSFIFIFLILSMSYESLINIKRFRSKQIYGVFAGALLLFLSYEHFLVDETYDFPIIYLSILFLILYLFVLQVYYRSSSRENLFNKGKRKRVLILFLIVAIAEVVINFNGTGLSTVTREYYTQDNEGIHSILNTIEDKDDSFYRIEKYKRRTKNDGAWHQYKGVSIFSSTAYAGLNDFQKALGFESSMNASSFYGQTPLTSSLFSVKYMLGKEEIADTRLTSLMLQSKEEYLYKNNYTLPLGFMLPTDLEEEWDLSSTDPFLVQNNFAKELLKKNESRQLEENDRKILMDLFTPVATSSSGSTIALNIQTSDEIYIYITTKNIETVNVSVIDRNGIEVSTEVYEDYNYRHILNLGSYEPGTFIHVSSEDAEIDLNLKAYAFNEEVFLNVYDQLSQEPFLIEEFEDTFISGSIYSKEDGLMYTSIPYDKGWSVKVDNIEVEPIPFKDALLAIPLNQGEHIIELTYRPQGLMIGSLISGISLLSFFVILFARKYIKE